VTPNARAAPRTSVVFPDPRSPIRSTMSPSRKRSAKSAPSASVSPGSEVSTTSTMLTLAPQPPVLFFGASVRGEPKKRPARERERTGRCYWEGWRQEGYRQSPPQSLAPTRSLDGYAFQNNPSWSASAPSPLDAAGTGASSDTSNSGTSNTSGCSGSSIANNPGSREKSSRSVSSMRGV
jgi:hypothetical protein